MFTSGRDKNKNSEEKEIRKVKPISLRIDYVS